MEIKTINIGKSGITDSVVGEIDNLLGKYKRIRVKLLKSARQNADRGSIAGHISNRTKSRLLYIRGNTFVLEKN